MDSALAGAAAAQVLVLPTGIIPSPDHLETLSIDLLARSRDQYSFLKGPTLTTNALQPLLQYRKMVKLHLNLPCSIWPDIEFLHTSVDSPPRRENGSPRFGGLHLLRERVETPRLPPTS